MTLARVTQPKPQPLSHGTSNVRGRSDPGSRQPIPRRRSRPRCAAVGVVCSLALVVMASPAMVSPSSGEVPGIGGGRTAGAAVTWGGAHVPAAAAALGPIHQGGVLSIPERAVEGDPFTAKAKFTPAVQGRPLRLQCQARSGWATVASAAEDQTGRAEFTRVARAAGSYQYRVVAIAFRGLARTVSPPRVLVTVARLPRIDIVTDDGQPILDDEEYSHASLVIHRRGSDLPGFRGTAMLRVRGNSTSWIRMKLPYKVKLDEKASILGMPDSKKWVLLANFYDRSMLRNDVAFEVSRRLELAWTPRMTPVELRLNGTFQGLYQWGEGIEVESQRVNIDNDNGDYLLEGDTWPDPDTPAFHTTRGLQLFVKEPEEIEEEGVGTVQAQVQAFEDALYSADFADPAIGYRPHVDVRSFIDWYLANEIMKTLEAPYLNSCWMYRAGGVLRMGPVWDFDQSSGNRSEWNGDDPTGWYLRTRGPASQITGAEGHWLVRMFKDPWFEAQVIARWAEVRATVMTLPEYVGAEAAEIAGAAARNYAPEAKGGAGMPIDATFLEGPTHLFQGSWGAERSYLRNWLTGRLAWMDEQLS
jgi:hypothetical protein